MEKVKRQKVYTVNSGGKSYKHRMVYKDGDRYFYKTLRQGIDASYVIYQQVRNIEGDIWIKQGTSFTVH